MRLLLWASPIVLASYPALSRALCWQIQQQPAHWLACLFWPCWYHVPMAKYVVFIFYAIPVQIERISELADGGMVVWLVDGWRHRHSWLPVHISHRNHRREVDSIQRQTPIWWEHSTCFVRFVVAPAFFLFLHSARMYTFCHSPPAIHYQSSIFAPLYFILIFVIRSFQRQYNQFLLHPSFVRLLTIHSTWW